MLGLRLKVRSSLTMGDWRTKLLIVSQLSVGFVALLVMAGLLTRNPLLLLSFTVAQLLLIMGVALFVVVALFAQRTLVLEKFGPGQVIFREGELGRHVYAIKSGTVEVLTRRAGSETPIVIKQLGPGDHFGEMALLRNAPRTATIRTVTEVEVFRMSPNNFALLYTNLPGLKEHFNAVMEARLRELELQGRERSESQADEVAKTSSRG